MRTAEVAQLTSKIQKKIYVAESDCWIWMGYCAPQGYGRHGVTVKRQVTTYWAHRFVYQQLKGQIPENMVLDHICRNRRCVNPDHLEVVSRIVNSQRSGAPRKEHRVKRTELTIRATEKERAYLIKLLQEQSSEEAKTLLQKLK